MPLSWLIKLVQGTSYSHYAIGYTSHTGEYIVLDATSKNTAIKTSKRFLSTYNIINEYTVTLQTDYDTFSLWYEKLLGTPYGVAQLLGVIIKSSRLGKGIICNELVLRLLHRFTQTHIYDIDTKDLNDTDKILRGISDER